MAHNLKDSAIATQCIHAGLQKNDFGAVITPIYQCSTFVFDNCDQGGNRFAGKEEGYIYTRLGNPTVTTLEERMACIEHTEAAACTSSGMGAIASTVLTLLKNGDHIIADDTLYGCTISLFEHQLRKFGIEVDFINTAEPGAIKAKLKPNTKIVYLETPANPTLKIVDLKAAAEQVHSQKGVLLVVDNTFATSVIQKPADFGADVVVYSMTKAINGHTDVVSGCICSTKEIISKIKMEGIKDITGAVLSPHDAFLVIRGLNTLELRVTRSAENAQKVAEFLEKHPAVTSILYPGLKSHPQHELAMKQMKLPGNMITFELKGGLNNGKKFLDNLHLMTLAVSLGGCESLIQHPASMTHACVPKAEREAAGISDGMIRLSVGVEGVDDIIADLKQSLDKIK